MFLSLKEEKTPAVVALAFDYSDFAVLVFGLVHLGDSAGETLSVWGLKAGGEERAPPVNRLPKKILSTFLKKMYFHFILCVYVSF